MVEFIDGWRVEESTEEGVAWNVYVATNPAEYSDTEGGILVGTLPSEVTNGGIIMDWAVPSVKGYSWAMLPAMVGMEGIEDGNEYAADDCGCDGPALFSGGFYVGLAPSCGPFSLGGNGAEFSDPIAGARLQKIP